MEGEELTEPDMILKIVIVGDSSVGKTCLLNRYVSNSFTSTAPTVGIGYGTKTIEINEIVIRLQVWDTAGQEAFRSIARTFYKGTNGVILTYSITRESSFTSVKSWLKEVQDGCEDDTPIFLVGNMKDLESQREVTPEQASILAESTGIAGSFEVSAASGEGVSEV